MWRSISTPPGTTIPTEPEGPGVNRRVFVPIGVGSGALAGSPA
jgi:hypothetical protein